MSKRDVLASVLDRSGIVRLLTRAPSWRGLVVLNYHRIGEPDADAGAPGYDCDPGLFSAAPWQFAEQVEQLTRHFDVVRLCDLDYVFSLRSGRHVLITFDDGYADNYETAFPILRAYGATAVFFITTGFLDDRRPAWWDEIAWMVRGSRRPAIEGDARIGRRIELDEPGRDAALLRLLRLYKSLPDERTAGFLDALGDACGTGRLQGARSLREGSSASRNNLLRDPWMTWDMVRELNAAGMDIGGHTVSHPVLSNLRPERQRTEIGDCKRRIEAELGRPITAFSYPVGQLDSFNDATRAALQTAGFRWAFSYYGGYVRGGRRVDRLNIPRVAIEVHTSRARFRSLTTLPALFARR